MKSSRKAGRAKRHPLVGSWVNGDEYESDVEYIVSRGGKGFGVRAIDRFDGEEGVVYDVDYDKKTWVLTFSVLWRSTGRFLNGRFSPWSPNRVSFTYSFTDQEMWFRKGTEPANAVEKPRLRRHGRQVRKAVGG